MSVCLSECVVAGDFTAPILSHTNAHSSTPLPPQHSHSALCVYGGQEGGGGGGPHWIFSTVGAWEPGNPARSRTGLVEQRAVMDYTWCVCLYIDVQWTFVSDHRKWAIKT